MPLPMMKPPFSSSSSLLRTKPRLCPSPYLFFLLTFILLAVIHYGHDFIFIFCPHNLQVLNTNSDTRPEVLFSAPEERREEQKVEELREEKSGRRYCDVFSGRWVRDELTRPLYEESECPYIQPQLTCQTHGRPDQEYRRWRWQPHGCDLPTLVEICNMLYSSHQVVPEADFSIYNFSRNSSLSFDEEEKIDPLVLLLPSLGFWLNIISQCMPANDH